MSSKPPQHRARHHAEAPHSESLDTFFPATPLELRRDARRPVHANTAPRWVRSGAWVHVFMEPELEGEESDGPNDDDATRFFDRTLLDAAVPAPRTAQDTLRCPLDATRPPGLGKRAGMSHPPAWLYIALTCVACGFSLSLILHTPEARPAEVVVHAAPASVMAPRAPVEGIEPALAEKPALTAIETLGAGKVQPHAESSSWHLHAPHILGLRARRGEPPAELRLTLDRGTRLRRYFSEK